MNYDDQVVKGKQEPRKSAIDKGTTRYLPNWLNELFGFNVKSGKLILRMISMLVNGGV